MSKNNPFGIFASTVSSTADLSLARVRGEVADEAQAERILAATVFMVSAKTGEDAAVIESDLRDISRFYPRARPYVKLVMRCLSEIEGQFSTRIQTNGAGEGFESPPVMWDCREAGRLAEAVLMVA